MSCMSTLDYVIAMQDVLSEQVLNGQINPAQFLFTGYVASNKRAGPKQQNLTSLLAVCSVIRETR